MLNKFEANSNFKIQLNVGTQRETIYTFFEISVQKAYDSVSHNSLRKKFIV